MYGAPARVAFMCPISLYAALYIFFFCGVLALLLKRFFLRAHIFVKCSRERGEKKYINKYISEYI